VFSSGYTHIVESRSIFLRKVMKIYTVRLKY